MIGSQQTAPYRLKQMSPLPAKGRHQVPTSHPRRFVDISCFRGSSSIPHRLPRAPRSGKQGPSRQLVTNAEKQTERRDIDVPVLGNGFEKTPYKYHQTT